MIDQQAYTLAVDDLFFLSGVLFVVLLVLVWATKPAKNVAVDAAARTERARAARQRTRRAA